MVRSYKFWSYMWCVREYRTKQILLLKDTRKYINSSRTSKIITVLHLSYMVTYRKTNTLAYTHIYFNRITFLRLKQDKFALLDRSDWSLNFVIKEPSLNHLKVFWESLNGHWKSQRLRTSIYGRILFRLPYLYLNLTDQCPWYSLS